MFRKGMGVTLFMMLLGVGLAISALPAAAQHSHTTTQTTTAMRANVIATSAHAAEYDKEIEFDGRISKVDGDVLGVVDSGGAETAVLVVPSTRIKGEGKHHHGHMSGAENRSELLVGLPVRVEGRGNCAGQLVAESIRYSCCDPCGCGHHED